MKIIPDSNILLRAVINDDPLQTPHARDALRDAEHIALTLPTLCEFVWVMRNGYKRSRTEVAAIVRTFVAQPNISSDRRAVDAGLQCLEAESDFADGVIAFEGQRLGGEVFVTFDRRAARQLARTGVPVELLP